MGVHGTMANVPCIFMRAPLYLERSHMPLFARACTAVYLVARVRHAW